MRTPDRALAVLQNRPAALARRRCRASPARLTTLRDISNPMSALPTVLLVDDGAQDRQLIGLVLRGAFGEVSIEEAADAAALARALSQGRFGLVITEHQLSWTRGAEVIALIRELRPEVPVVVLTASPLAEVALKLLHLGYDALVPKTSTGYAELGAVLNRLVAGSRRRALEHRPSDQGTIAAGVPRPRATDESAELAYVVSHDLRQPLNQVVRYLELIEEKAGARLEKSERELLAQARRGALRLETLVDGVHRYASAGKRGALTPISLEQVLVRVLERLADERQASQAEVTHDSLPTVQASAPQMDQLFSNLLANAFKFRGAKPARVHVGAQANGDHWRLSVSDQGIGIDPKDAERIFGLFQRLHTDSEYPGSGIGLALCKRIVARHGGRLWVDSMPGAGATFYWTLPTEAAANAAGAEE